MSFSSNFGIKITQFDFLITFLKQENIKMIILFGHQNMPKGSFIRLQCCFLVHILKIKQTRIDFIDLSPSYRKVVKNFIRL